MFDKIDRLINQQRIDKVLFRIKRSCGDHATAPLAIIKPLNLIFSNFKYKFGHKVHKQVILNISFFEILRKVTIFVSK